MPESRPPGEKLRILIVDDIDINCELLIYYLQEIALLDVAYNGETAIAKTRRNRYDVVLMDISLGIGMDGIEALEKIRLQKHNRRLPVIAVTGSATEFDESDFLARGFTEFLSKPVSKTTLLNTIKKVVSNEAFNPL